MLHELDELGGAHNLFFCLGAQFAGPLSFQEFFQDTVAEWEKQTGRTARIELATSKDITDAILANPARARQVAVIDMRYWQYRPDGTLWAPEGGKNLAFREELIARISGARPTIRRIPRRTRYTGRCASITTSIRTTPSWRGMAARVPSRC